MLFRQLFLAVGIFALMALMSGVLGPKAGPASASGAAAVAAGHQHTCALTAAGGVKCWGWNGLGQLGDGSEVEVRSTPVDVSGLRSGAAAVAAGIHHTCALTTAGGVKCWGAGSSGQLGNGTASDVATPVDVLGLTTGAAAVAAGADHTCAVTTAGGLKCWGRNAEGQLGSATAELCPQPGDPPGPLLPCSTTPLDVPGLTSGVTAVAAGNEHTCALTTAGGVKCWGGNSHGELGDGTTTGHTTPADVSGLANGVVAVTAAHAWHTCALTTAGGLKCWGRNFEGQLGDGTITNRLTPVDVSGLTSDVAAVAAGVNHTCAVTTGSGLKCWGRNAEDQLGTETIELCPDLPGPPLPCSTTPVNVFGLTSGVAAVAGGIDHSCAVTTAGGVKCWGSNELGWLGDATATDRPTPVAVFGFGAPPDADGDGCTDTRENGIDETLGGQRDPKNFWDFYDPNQDGSVSLLDFLAVLARFNSGGDPSVDPLSDPPPPPAYHPRFDRGGQAPGGDPWDELPANGSIGLADFLSVLRQFGHTCA